ncbi:hypothetical protein [Pontibacillus sp. HMF3514]|uniref:hypothetical protein n=1 Tax=Pontibacillus sp. HMF3514 TaxID=2692425 RepID=UPI00131F87B9|nr:hypothetical protein [Pontibacillus sp. HMF3514]QHE53951.1 hypothetical protein GS400_18840 [Pontibacillus sp. HMF3514]
MKELKSILLAFWLLFICYALFLTPIEGDLDYVATLFSLDEPEPLIMAVFLLLGVWPMVFGLLLLENDQSTISAWPYVMFSFLFGAFALLPYFIFHRDQRKRENRTSNRIGEMIKNPFFPFALLIFTMIFVIYGLIYGNVEVYQEAFFNSRFVHVMTLDFFMLTLLSVLGISHHAYHRNGQGTRLSILGLIPIIGALVYLFITHWQESER